MADKEIIIDGVIYNKCNGCFLYDGNVCTGAKTYEDNAERDGHICDEHLASQFWKVFKELKRKEQECDNYKQALDDIENYCRECNLKFDFTADIILQIINETKESNDNK